MYRCVNLRKNSIAELKRLSVMSTGFNTLNQDFFKMYEKSNLIRQLIQRRKVRMLKKGSELTGFVWFEYFTGNICGIRSLFSLEKENIITYRMLIDSIPRCSNIQYKCRDNGYNFSILEGLGFEKSEGEIEMSLWIREQGGLLEINSPEQEGLLFKNFEKGKDEGLRCWIQNDIFRDNNRVPLTLNDIFFDVSQNYFLEGGAAFLYKDGECIGYGQIIIDRDVPFIVNLGIIEGQRGKGYGKILLMHLLEVVRNRNFDQVRLKVRSGNEAAMILYRGVGFKTESETYKWQLKR
jgi:ribosomal protein S18 acetylase RimI-like enzyme